MLKLGSLFDGIGGWQLAAIRAGVEPVWSSEIERFPCAVTQYHFPNTVQLGDINDIDGRKIEPVDIVCAGSPCQDLSVAGKREGLEGERSGLFRQATRIIREMQESTGGRYPRFFVFENVPGLLSSNKGLDFKSVLEEITETDIPMPGSGRWAKAGVVRSGRCEVAWRVLDAQYWGVPQRRKRIFLVADFGGRSASQLLFECNSMQGDTQPRRKEEWQDTRGVETSTDSTVSSMTLYENHGQDSRLKLCTDVSPTISAKFGMGGNNTPLVVYKNGVKTYSFQRSSHLKESTIAHTLQSTDFKRPSDLVLDTTLDTTKLVRKLTPLECERLQGLPDDWTLINDKSCSTSARYRAIGNGMAQPVADWVIHQIAVSSS